MKPIQLQSARTLVALAAAGVAVGMLAGCASSDPNLLRIFRVEPVQKVTHGGHVGDEAVARGYVALARQYEGEGRTELAIDAWRKALAEDGSNPEANNALGMALATRGRYAEAAQAFARADQFKPGDVRVMNNLGYSQMMAGQNAAAVHTLERALAADPQHAKAIANLAAAKTELARAETVVVQLAGGERIGVPAAITRKVAAPGEVDTVLTSRVDILNGNGVPGAAGRMREIVRERGVADTRLGNLPHFDAETTRVVYRAGYAGYARQVARRLPLSSELAPAEPGDAGTSPVRVVIGHDARSTAACAALGGCTASSLKLAASEFAMPPSQ